MYINNIILDANGKLKKLARTLSAINGFQVTYISDDPVTVLRNRRAGAFPEIIFASCQTIEQIADSSTQEAIDQIINNTVVIVTNQRLIGKRFYYLLRHLCFLPADFDYLELMALLSEILCAREQIVKDTLDERFYRVDTNIRAATRIYLEEIISIKRQKESSQLSLDTKLIPVIKGKQNNHFKIKYNFQSLAQLLWLREFLPVKDGCIINLLKAVRIKGKTLVMKDGENIEIEDKFLSLFKGKSELYSIYHHNWEKLRNPAVASLCSGF